MNIIKISFFVLCFNSCFNFAWAESTAAETRLDNEELLQLSRFTLLAHKQNYLLPVTYNFKPNNEPNDRLKARGIDTGLDRVMRIESKFQLSFKFPIASSVFLDDDGIWAAYTQLSYWQVYNQNSSRPFRESNYEPEIFYRKRNDIKFFNINFDAFMVGLVHQSNGQTENLSRSWNRIYFTGLFSIDHFALAIKTWYRVPDGANDDNPQLEKYMGKFELRFAYRNADWVYSLLLRNSFEGKNRGYREVGITIPINNKINGFLQYANGYGESLLDYYVSTNRIGLGIIVSDLL
ncbi:MAG: phospholipase [Bdellovibrionales bacterium CG12_big_fil_rev_8_21_14_0_65_38_15]|nr:MAG: phospholipase [Bdellovibrionales bacterium CG22_combo_CG10-13_8_21_14_all_38_13]PIQ56077.1 MAG: phospholipase [Bdellovibrionales bacterium CG12_big_fil_rev_8_21_14_0_65_38_15]